MKSQPGTKVTEGTKGTKGDSAPASKFMNGCEYLERNDGGKLHECGQPASYRGVKPPKLFYCEAHGDFVRRHFEIATLDGRSLGKPIKWRNQG